MKTGVFLQVRLDSQRLPRKALKVLQGKTVTEHCLEALSRVEADCRVLVTEPDSAPALEPLARRLNWQLFVGSKDHVLDRFVSAGRHFPCDWILRATGDNPLVSAAAARAVLDRTREEEGDYGAMTGPPVGTGVEVLRRAALERAWESGPDAYEREHVSPYLYRRPETFRILRFPCPPDWAAPEARVTLDTPEDWWYLEALFHDLYRGGPIELEALIPWLLTHPR